MVLERLYVCRFSAFKIIVAGPGNPFLDGFPSRPGNPFFKHFVMPKGSLKPLPRVIGVPVPLQFFP
jgi:hypothetical protein